jgi:hypothetical protein
MTENGLYRRILRREMHGSRSTAVVVALVLLVLALAYVATECVLAAVDAPPLLIDPADAVAAATSGSSVMLGIGVVAVVLGLLSLVVAVTPARRARHSVPHSRMAVVVDNGVLAGAVGRAARSVAQVGPDRVKADVSARVARVVVTPVSGVAVDGAAVRAAAEGVINTLRPVPRLRSNVVIESNGRVGA